MKGVIRIVTIQVCDDVDVNGCVGVVMVVWC